MAFLNINDKFTKSYVFLHLNTTCLPTDEEHECRITEICLMAINRDSFEERLRYDQNGRPVLPRVINKLVLCVDPRVDITDRAMEISGLTNECLSKQKPLKKYILSIKTFLKRLEDPVCLIAHYGNQFDFLVLKRELKRANVFNDEFASLYCADSLPAFRVLDSIDKDSKKRKTEEVAKLSLKRSRTEHDHPRGKTAKSALKKSFSFPIQMPKQSRSFKLREYFEEMFKRKPEDAHTAEGYCKALVNIAHNTPGFFQWVDKNKKEMRDI